MKLLEIVMEPKAELEFSREELDALIRMSESHYDATCRAMSKQGGVLFGLRNCLERGKAKSWALRFREIDLMCKLTEVAGYQKELVPIGARLWLELSRVLAAMNKACEGQRELYSGE
jgi:hypothetical protein